MIGRSPRGGSAALWSGLTLCAFALTGLVASTPAQEPPRSSSTHTPVRTAEQEPYCPPGSVPHAGTDLRVTDPGVPAAEGMEPTPEEAAEHDERLQGALLHLREEEIAPPWTIPVVFHVISARDGSGRVEDARIHEQVEVLNRAYRGDFAQGSEGTDTGFRFELDEITHTVNDTWFHHFGDHRDTIRPRLRQGGPETLNVYVAALGPGLLGFSTFPQNYAHNSEQDGVAISHEALPGGGLERFDEGHTGTHEIGHWLGLFHTFQNGCQSPGDYVDDTPYERESASGCPVGRNTCPQHPGLDPVTNFMNYSDDACMTHFTPGQAQRMAEHWVAFRDDPRV